MFMRPFLGVHSNYFSTVIRFHFGPVTFITTGLMCYLLRISAGYTDLVFNLFCRDSDEALKELTVDERKELTYKEFATYSRTNYSNTRREHALKFYN